MTFWYRAAHGQLWHLLSADWRQARCGFRPLPLNPLTRGRGAYWLGSARIRPRRFLCPTCAEKEETDA